MALLKKLSALGIDVHDQVSVVQLLNRFAITDSQKTDMLRQYLTELQLTLTQTARAAARFPVNT